MSEIHVFFFRGLSLNGGDNVEFARLDLGPMGRHLERELGSRGVHFHQISGMGAGSLIEMAARARAQLDLHPVWRDPSIPVHFLGHSAGGLLAHLALANAPPGKVLSCVTVATPHRGAALARWCLDMPRRYPWSYLLLRVLGFHIGQHAAFIEGFTAERVALLPAPAIATTRLASIVCVAPRREWCWPLRLIYLIPAFRDFRLESDGMIERETQAFGEVIATLPIDHFRQLGFVGGGSRFTEMCEVLLRYFRSFAP